MINNRSFHLDAGETSMAHVIDQVCQIGIAATGLTAMFLVAMKIKWGFVVGLISSPFWFGTAYVNEQWGIFILNIFYAVNWIFGIYVWFWRDKKEVEQTEASD